MAGPDGLSTPDFDGADGTTGYPGPTVKRA